MHTLFCKIGRGAPELDIFEVQGNSGSQSLISSLQMAPLLPPGLSWLDNGAPGLYYPGENVTVSSALTVELPPYLLSIIITILYHAGAATEPSAWYGELSGDLPRSGTRYTVSSRDRTQCSQTQTDCFEVGGLDKDYSVQPVQDSISAATPITEGQYQSTNILGVDWMPGEYIRWYWEGDMIYQVSQESLQERKSANRSVGQRDIPVEPMYIIMQVAMSHDWSPIDPNLKLPTAMEVEYVRLYQEPGQ